MKTLMNSRGRLYEHQILIFLALIALAAAFHQPTWGRGILTFFIVFFLPIVGFFALLLITVGIGRLIQYRPIYVFFEWFLRVVYVLLSAFFGGAAGAVAADVMVLPASTGNRWFVYGVVLGGGASIAWQVWRHKKKTNAQFQGE